MVTGGQVSRVLGFGKVGVLLRREIYCEVIIRAMLESVCVGPLGSDAKVSALFTERTNMAFRLLVSGIGAIVFHAGIATSVQQI